MSRDTYKGSCPRCGSPRWVSVSVNGGLTRVPQCVPCGAIHAAVLGAAVLGPGAAQPPERDRYKAALELAHGALTYAVEDHHLHGDECLCGAALVTLRAARDAAREALAPSEAEQAAAEAAGPEPDFPDPSVVAAQPQPPADGEQP